MRPDAACSTESQIDVSILAHGPIVHVDLDQLQILADALAIAHPEVEGRADDHQHIRFRKRLRAGPVEVMRIAGRQQSAARTVEVSRNVQASQQRDRLVLPARGPHLLAVKNRRALGVQQNIGQLVDIARIADGAGRGPVFARLRNDCLRNIDLAVENIARNLQIHRARSAVERFARRHRDHVRHAFGARNARGELRDGRHHVDVRQILERPHLVLGERTLAADVQDRTLGAKRRRDAGHRIGAARARSGDDATELARLARVAVGGVRRDLLVPYVDDANALVDAAVIDVDDVAAAKREDRVHPFVLERFRHQVTARDDARIAGLALQGVFGGACLRLNRCGVYACHVASNFESDLGRLPQLGFVPPTSVAGDGYAARLVAK
jgi:hypothetical protein